MEAMKIDILQSLFLNRFHFSFFSKQEKLNLARRVTSIWLISYCEIYFGNPEKHSQKPLTGHIAWFCGFWALVAN